MKEGFIRGMSARASRGFRRREFWLIAGLVMTLLGFIIVPFQVMERSSPGWMQLAFESVPFYLCLGLVAAGGVLFGKANERLDRGEIINWGDLLQASAQRMILGLSIGLFFLTIWTVLWFLLGLIVILKEVPGVALLLHLLNSGLKTISLLSLFIFIPIVALYPKSVKNMVILGFNRALKNVYETFLLILFSFLPVIVIWAWMWHAEAELNNVVPMERGLLAIGMRHVGMIPVLVLIGSPVLIFWYSLLFEAHKEWEREENR